MNQQEDPYVPFDVEKPKPSTAQIPVDQLPLVFKFFRLNHNITKTNFVCAQIHLILEVFGFFVAGSLMPLILLHKDYYNVDQHIAGRLTALMLVLQVIVKMIVSVVYGHFSDKFGRRAMIYYGSASYIISCFIVPTQTTIFPGFILGKLLLANGASAISSVSLTADYIHDVSKGEGVGLSSACSFLGALLANLYLKLLLNNGVSLGTCYILTGTIVFSLVLINSFGLKGGRYFLENIENTEEDHTNLPFFRRFGEAMKVYISNGWLIIALIVQILGSSDFYVFSTFLMLYVKSLMAPNVSDDNFNIWTNSIQTYFLAPGLISSIIYGYFIDKKEKPLTAAMFALIGAAIGSLITCFVSGPYDWKILVAALLLGSTIPGLFVVSTYLSIRYFPQDKRGIMIGFKGLVGHIGYMILTVGGGFVFDAWRKDGPFIICSIMLTVAMFAIYAVYRLKIAPKVPAN